MKSLLLAVAMVAMTPPAVAQDANSRPFTMVLASGSTTDMFTGRAFVITSISAGQHAQCRAPAAGNGGGQMEAYVGTLQIDGDPFLLHTEAATHIVVDAGHKAKFAAECGPILLTGYQL
jgi:hypothetical protein